MSDPQTELAEYIEKCRAMHRSHVGKCPTFAHAVSALADQLDDAHENLRHARDDLFAAQLERQREHDIRCKTAGEAENLAMMVKRLCRAVPSHMRTEALDYLLATGRLGSVTRIDAALAAKEKT